MSDSIITSEPNRITVTTGSLVTQYSDHPLSAAKQITLLHTQIKHLKERLAAAEAAARFYARYYDGPAEALLGEEDRRAFQWVDEQKAKGGRDE